MTPKTNNKTELTEGVAFGISCEILQKYVNILYIPRASVIICHTEVRTTSSDQGF
jgi:hypothetical protein